MRRVQILLDEQLDDLLEFEALRQGRSKSDLVRASLRREIAPLPPIEEDPLWEIVGMVDMEPVEDIDEFLYG
ncbi:MAG: ribbon-helix-helix protein, CopG family [Dehalococcoidia bacterium]